MLAQEQCKSVYDALGVVYSAPPPWASFLWPCTAAPEWSNTNSVANSTSCVVYDPLKDVSACTQRHRRALRDGPLRLRESDVCPGRDIQELRGFCTALQQLQQLQSAGRCSSCVLVASELLVRRSSQRAWRSLAGVPAAQAINNSGKQSLRQQQKQTFAAFHQEQLSGRAPVGSLLALSPRNAAPQAHSGPASQSAPHAKPHAGMSA